MTDLQTAITKAIDYLSAQAVEIPHDVWHKAICKGVLKAESGDLGKINARYHSAVTSSLLTYLEGGSAAGPKNSFKRATIEAFGGAWDAGWGGKPADGEALAWFNSRVEQELGFIDTLFVEAKELRKDEEADLLGWASQKADSYTHTLQSIYNAAKMWANKNQMLKWRLGNTEKHCETCKGLNGKWHRASWYIARNYIPRKPGASMECGGYHCDCGMEDKDGNEFTI